MLVNCRGVSYDGRQRWFYWVLVFGARNMNRLTVYVVCGLLLVGGCGESRVTRPGGKVLLPAEVAGTWQARGNAWKIVLTEDGHVASATIPLGNVEVRPGKTTKVEMADSGISTYKAGRCDVAYDPQIRELRVEVIVDQVSIAFMSERIAGNTKDVFIGPVSEDGKVWEADWLSFFNLGERFPMDPNAVGEGLVFDKVESE